MVELLVVIGISALLFGLLLKPLVDSLSLTQQAQATAAAQDSARKTIEVMTRELGSAAYVYDNASHPFQADAAYANGNGASPYPVDRFTNFLNLQIPTSTPGLLKVGHAYNAKLDVVLPRHQPGTITDPTTDSEARLDSGVVKPTDLLLPAAPGTTLIRYFVGLKNPELDYHNRHENSGSTSGTDNTYVLYRAQFSPFAPNSPSANPNLFAATASGGPELDDPDFFRKVTQNDINWLSPTHAPYSGTEASDHNTRLLQWEKIAQRIIGAPQVDLLMLPHNSDGTISYDTSAPFNGIAHYGGMQDPVTGGAAYPVVNTSVTFKPTVTNDATPATNTDYAGVGVVSNGVDNNGLPYISTLYRTTGQSWNDPFTVNLYPINYPTNSTYFRIERSTADVAANQISAGDLVEYQITPNAMIPVYNITFGAPVKAVATNNYIPAVINPDSGSISFAVNALPDPDLYSGANGMGLATLTTVAVKRADTEWPVAVTNGQVDLKSLPKSPLNIAATTEYVTNAILVPGSIRVYDKHPDASGNPTHILMTAVGPSDIPADNQYLVDYRSGLLTFANGFTGSVGIVWQYQANLSVTDPSSPVSKANPYAPMSVKVNYQTRDLIALNIGVRIYPTSGSIAKIVNASSNVKVGNSNR